MWHSMKADIPSDRLLHNQNIKTGFQSKLIHLKY